MKVCGLTLAIASCLIKIRSTLAQKPEPDKPIENQVDLRVPKREDIDTRLIKGYACIKPAMVCKPDDYESSKAPSTTVLANIVDIESNVIDDIDVKAMKIKYSTKMVFVWQDERLKFFNLSGEQKLDDMNPMDLWIPEIPDVTIFQFLRASNQDCNVTNRIHKSL